MVRFYKNLQETDPPVPQDDASANVITVRARYKIPGLVHREKGAVSVTTAAYMLRSLLDMPQSRRRYWPYGIPTDRYVRHSIDFECPFPLGIDQQSQVITAAGIEYRVQKAISQNHFYSQYDLQFKSGYVPADQMDKFVNAVDEIFESMSTTIHPATPAPAAHVAPVAPAAAQPGGDRKKTKAR